MNIKKFGAIDIGSNAMRLLISQVLEDETEYVIKKVALIRLPIRLGNDSFTERRIQNETLERFIEGMHAYKHLMRVHNVLAYKAYATSAMREAKNGKQVVEIIKQKTGIQIDIIDGKEEADIIFSGHLKQGLESESTYVYVDVGGGSTEITILANNEIIASRSFKVGTLRLLNETVNEEEWARMKRWVKLQSKNLHHVEMIGSGGNINKIYKLSEKKYPRPMLYHEIKTLRNELSSLSFAERMKKYTLNADRADVIIPASDIFYSVMKWSDCSIIHVPKIGLSDGIISQLYMEHKAQENTENKS